MTPTELIAGGVALFIFTGLLAATQLLPERTLRFVSRLFDL